MADCHGWNSRCIYVRMFSIRDYEFACSQDQTSIAGGKVGSGGCNF